MGDAVMIEIRNLTKFYWRQKALDNVSIDISQGEIIGLFGENGAGKTTLIKSILGLVSFAGDITFDGEPVTRRNIGRLSFATSEHSFFPNLTPKAHMEFYREHFGKFNEKRFYGLTEFFELPMDKVLRNFSTGQKNQFEVIMALCQGADYIFMDEPFAGNDVFNREDFYKVLLGILEPNETVLLSTHLIEEVSGFIGRSILIRKGRIVGDAQVSDLEEQGKSLIDYVKETYDYRADRVSKALADITGREGDDA
jgi:ABC-2 type transport system ATP-binding protein